MNAAWWLVVLGIENPFGAVPTVSPIVAGSATGLLTMGGWRPVKWLSLIALCGGIVGGVMLLNSALIADAGFAGIVGCLVGIFVCWAGWKPLRSPLLRPVTGSDLVMLFLLVVCPYWSMSFAYAFRFTKPFGSWETLGMFAGVYVLCLLIAFACAKLWRAGRVEATPQTSGFRDQAS
jgi:hypothetical protein